MSFTDRQTERPDGKRTRVRPGTKTGAVLGPRPQSPTASASAARVTDKTVDGNNIDATIRTKTKSRTADAVRRRASFAAGTRKILLYAIATIRLDRWARLRIITVAFTRARRTRRGRSYRFSDDLPSRGRTRDGPPPPHPRLSAAGSVHTCRARFAFTSIQMYNNNNNIIVLFYRRGKRSCAESESAVARIYAATVSTYKPKTFYKHPYTSARDGASCSTININD